MPVSPAELDARCANGFSGAVSVSRAGRVPVERAYGFAHRAHRIPATPATRFGIASGSTGFTALVAAGLAADGVLDRRTPARDRLGDDLPLIGPDVTVEHLLTHTSGSGDGGAYGTVGDLRAFWSALFAGRIGDPAVVDALVRPRSTAADGLRHGAGFWLRPTGPAVFLEGFDAGVSFRSAHDPTTGVTHTVVSNTSAGAWPVSGWLAEVLGC